MSCSINIDWKVDWKSISALGLAAVGIIFALRMDPDAVKEAFCKLADTCREGAGAIAAANS